MTFVFQNTDLVRLLDDAFPGKIFYLDHLSKFAKNREELDSWKSSLIEQEIGLSTGPSAGARS